MHLCYGGPIYTIQCGGQRVTFEMHKACGPVPLRASDLRERALSAGHMFWREVSRWAQTGAKVDGHGRCVIGDSIAPKMVQRQGKEFYIGPSDGWTCFHCGQTFLTEDSARKHFGVMPDAKPRCQSQQTEGMT